MQINLQVKKKVVSLQTETPRSLGRVARHRSAKPSTPVRIWKRPQKEKDFKTSSLFCFYTIYLKHLEFAYSQGENKCLLFLKVLYEFHFQQLHLYPLLKYYLHS